MLKRSWTALIAIAVTAALGLTACGGDSNGSSTAGSGKPKSGGVLTVGLESPWVSLDPAKVTTFNGLDAQRAVYDGLLVPDPKGKLVPVLATGYDVSEDGLTYTVTLRDGVKFQDGTSLDAAAVKKNLDRMRDPATASTSAGNTKVIANVDAPAPNKVVITLSKPSAGFATEVLAGPPGFIVSPTALEKPDADIANNPVGAGPFKFDSQLSGDSLSLVKWDGYWQKNRPYLDGVKFKVIPDEQARYASIQTNTIQVAVNASTTSVMEAKSSSSVNVDDLGGVGSKFVTLQTQAAPFDNLKARRAASMAINPDAINKALFNGLMKDGQQSPFPPGHPYDPGKVKGYPSYDLDKAKALVKEIGGLSFTLTIVNRPDDLKTAQALVAQWKAAGIDATISQVDSPTLVVEANTNKYQAILYRWRGSFDPAGNTDLFFNSALATPGVPSPNVSLTNDPMVDKALAEGATTLDPAARKVAYKKLDEVLAAYTPYIYLWAANWFRISAATVHGIPKSPDSVDIYTNAYIS